MELSKCVAPELTTAASRSIDTALQIVSSLNPNSWSFHGLSGFAESYLISTLIKEVVLPILHVKKLRFRNNYQGSGKVLSRGHPGSCLHTRLGNLLGNKANDDVLADQACPDSTAQNCPDQQARGLPRKLPSEVSPSLLAASASGKREIGQAEEPLCAADKAVLVAALSVFSPSWALNLPYGTCGAQEHPHPTLHSHFRTPAGT